MNLQYVLRKLAEVMSWDDDTAQAEFARIELMSRMKYDGYQDFLAGARFSERLLDWVQQFGALEDRKTAYRFVRDQLIFISTAEMHHLIGLSWPEFFRPEILRFVADSYGIADYQVRVHQEASNALGTLQRKCLFIELSDGARIDVFRRANAGISNEQIVTTSRFNEDKWNELLKDLQDELGDAEARFEFVFLLDDFTASGTSLLRFVDGKWKGKLRRFWDESRQFAGSHLSEDVRIHVHHYLATQRAREAVLQRHAERAAEGNWFDAEFTFGMVLPQSIRMEETENADVLDLISRHFDASIAPEKHVCESGCESMMFGYGDSRLPVILDHNTPNNTIPLLWATSSGNQDVHQMRPLFPRRQRHDVLDDSPDKQGQVLNG